VIFVEEELVREARQYGLSEEDIVPYAGMLVRPCI
jgi:hypothetical protein